MKTNFKDQWPVNHRCERTERKRQGQHDDISAESWMWFSALFILLVVGPAIVEWIL